MDVTTTSVAPDGSGWIALAYVLGTDDVDRIRVHPGYQTTRDEVAALLQLGPDDVEECIEDAWYVHPTLATVASLRFNNAVTYNVISLVSRFAAGDTTLVPPLLENYDRRTGHASVAVIVSVRAPAKLAFTLRSWFETVSGCLHRIADGDDERAAEILGTFMNACTTLFDETSEAPTVEWLNPTRMLEDFDTRVIPHYRQKAEVAADQVVDVARENSKLRAQLVHMRRENANGVHDTEFIEALDRRYAKWIHADPLGPTDGDRQHTFDMDDLDIDTDTCTWELNVRQPRSVPSARTLPYDDVTTVWRTVQELDPRAQTLVQKTQWVQLDLSQGQQLTRVRFTGCFTDLRQYHRQVRFDALTTTGEQAYRSLADIVPTDVTLRINSERETPGWTPSWSAVLSRKDFKWILKQRQAESRPGDPVPSLHDEPSSSLFRIALARTRVRQRFSGSREDLSIALVAAENRVHAALGADPSLCNAPIPRTFTEAEARRFALETL
jgi:hypothetical protein